MQNILKIKEIIYLSGRYCVSILQQDVEKMRLLVLYGWKKQHPFIIPNPQNRSFLI